MWPEGYCAMIRSKNHRFDLRIHLVRYAMLAKLTGGAT